MYNMSPSCLACIVSHYVRVLDILAKGNQKKKKNYYLPLSKYALTFPSLRPFFIHIVPEAGNGFLHYLSIECLSILQSHLKYYFFHKAGLHPHNRV